MAKKFGGLNDLDDFSEDELLEDELLEDELLEGELLEDELFEEGVLEDRLSNQEVFSADLNDLEGNHDKVEKNLHRERSGMERGVDKIKSKSSKNSKMSRASAKKQKKRRVFLIGMLSALVVGIIICAIAIIGKYTPTKEMMSGYDYFEVEKTDNVVIILNNKISESNGIYVDGRLCLPQEFVAENLNQRFYLDKESGSVLFTNSTVTNSYKLNSKAYTDSLGGSYSEEFTVAVEVSGKVYIDFEYMSRFSDFTYVCCKDPDRVVISNDFSEHNYVTVTKDTAVRYRGGIKSPVLENVKKGTQLLCTKTIEGWMEVRTESGFLGYIKDNCVSEIFPLEKEHSYTDNFTSISKNYKISLAWFQVTNTTANANIAENLDGTQGITTISPTWYSITSNSGDMSCLATKAFVDTQHSKGYEVWPLIDDFNDAISGAELYSSKAARTKMINTLISDSKKYGYDGINLDCEKVTKDSAKHFLQFVRELSVACRANNIVLSSDNYKPASFNAFYDLKEQAAFADYIIIMGYDEHYAGSESGSVASIGFVKEGIMGALASVPAAKLINAVPFYTRIWTISKSTGATTSKAVGMQSAIDDLNTHKIPAVWDDVTGQYFGSYETDSSVVKIWLEEDRSIEEKMKLIKENNLAGVAEWKLGLEKKSVWSVITKYNK